MPIKYDLEWPDGFDDLSIELRCFRAAHSVEQGGLGMAGHFKRAALLLWGPQNKRKEFIWHPWADKMLEEACRHKYLGVAGPGGIGKSDFFAIWAIINWLCDPINTMVIVTSTTMNASRKRIWGSIVDYYGAIPGTPPGKLADSLGIIRTHDPVRKIKVSDKAGISLVAGDASKEKESMDKLDGCHNKRVIMIADELPKLSPSLVKFATGNLSKNQWFQFIGIGNPTKKFDPHGILCTPKAGWDSVDENDSEWDTPLGHCIRFDSEQSPNILAKKVIYNFLPTEEDIAMSVRRNGADSLAHWSQCRGFWPPDGSDPDCIYSEADIEIGKAMDAEVKWIGNPIPLNSCDPARGAGGDAFKSVIALFGLSDTGWKILVTRIDTLTERRDDPDPYLFQIAKQHAALIREHGVLPENVAYDGTGPAGEYGQILTKELDNAVLHRVDFNGPASDLLYGIEQKPCSEVFADKVSELWMVGKDYILSGQIKGLTEEIISDMLERQEVTGKYGGRGTKRAVESKRVMKKRIKRSPDAGDGFFVLLNMCRHKFNFQSQVALVANKNAEAEWRRMSREAAESNTMALPMHLEEMAAKHGDEMPWEGMPQPQEEVELGFFQ